MRTWLEALVLPPGGLYVLALIGLLVLRRRRRLGYGLVGLAALLLVLCTLPLVAATLLGSLQGDPALRSDAIPAGAQAIVVLSADQRTAAPEYGGVTVGPLTLERMRYAARLARATGLPLLVTGGVLSDGCPPVAESMADVFARDLGVRVRWVEDRAATTRENGRFSAPLLRDSGVRTILLVTHAWHMPRAAVEFAHAGLEVIPAPTGFRAPARLEPAALRPSARAFYESGWALHEWLGRAWYRLTR